MQSGAKGELCDPLARDFIAGLLTSRRTTRCIAARSIVLRVTALCFPLACAPGATLIRHLRSSLISAAPPLTRLLSLSPPSHDWLQVRRSSTRPKDDTHGAGPLSRDAPPPVPHDHARQDRTAHTTGRRVWEQGLWRRSLREGVARGGDCRDEPRDEESAAGASLCTAFGSFRAGQ